MNAITTTSNPAPLALVQPSALRFTPEQRNIILQTCCGGASEEEAGALIAVAEVRGLNPLLGECYFVKRWNAERKREDWAIQASIDSFRIKAEETGDYAGQDEPEYEYDDQGRVTLARVRVYRKSVPGRAFAVGVARWDEYVQKKRDGSPTKFWRDMPHNQLAKCAEAIGLRKAFPKVLGKLYTPDEMAQVDNGAADDAVSRSGRHDPQTGEVPHEPAPNGQRSEAELQAVVEVKKTIEAIASKEDERAVITQILRNPFSDESRAELKKAIEARRRKLSAEARKGRPDDADTTSDARAQEAIDRAVDAADAARGGE